MNLHIKSSSDNMAADMRYVIDRLHAENVARAGEGWNRAEVRLFLRNEDGQIFGGCFGSMTMGWIEILILWVEESARGQGWGVKMMEMAELTAKKHGALGALVQTTSFQARPFYENLGYKLFGEVEDYPPGHITYYMRKRWG